MSLDGKEGFRKKQKPIPPAGLQLAVCYSIIDLGTHDETFPGQAPKPTPKVHFSWEFPGYTGIFDEKKGPQPLAVFQEYTIAAGDRAKLPKMLSSWGRIPIKEITKISAKLLGMFLGQACTINVVHETSKKADDVDADTGQKIQYANIGNKGESVMPRMEGMVKPDKTVNPPIFFNLDQFSWEQYAKIPKHLQDRIAKSKEWPSILAKYPKPADTVTQNNTVNAQVNTVENNNSTVHTENQTGMPAF